MRHWFAEHFCSAGGCDKRSAKALFLFISFWPVFAVEASDLATVAKKIVSDNKLEGIVKVAIQAFEGLGAT